MPSELAVSDRTHGHSHLKERFKIAAVIVSRTLKCVGLTESSIDETLDDLITTGSNPTIGLLAQMQLGEIHVRLTAKAADEAAARILIAPLEAKVRERLGLAVFGADEDEYEGTVADLIRRHGLTIAVAECGLTGGVGHELSLALAGDRHFAAAVTANLPEALEQLVGPRDAPQAGMASSVPRWPQRWLRGTTSQWHRSGISGYRRRAFAGKR